MGTGSARTLASTRPAFLCSSALSAAPAMPAASPAAQGAEAPPAGEAVQGCGKRRWPAGHEGRKRVRRGGRRRRREAQRGAERVELRLAANGEHFAETQQKHGGGEP